METVSPLYAHRNTPKPVPPNTKTHAVVYSFCNSFPIVFSWILLVPS